MPYQQKKQNGCILFGFRRVLIRVRNLMPRANSLTGFTPLEKLKNVERRVAMRSLTGFTLIEIIIALSIFIAALMITGGIITAATSAQRKVTEFRRVQDNARFALEYLSKEIRTGKEMESLNWDGSSCIGLCPRIRFCNDRGERVEYYADPNINVFIRSHAVAGVNCFGTLDSGTLSMTSNEMLVTSVLFGLIGGTIGPVDGQPRITIVFRADSVPGLVSVRTDMNFQTTITQRLRDY